MSLIILLTITTFTLFYKTDSYIIVQIFRFTRIRNITEVLQCILRTLFPGSSLVL
jgi:hypothetical protein